MVSRKYTGDYRLENITTPSGKVKTVPVYRGEWFAFVCPETDIKRLKLKYIVSSLLITLLFILVLTLNAPCGHTYYVMVPFAAMIFPVFFSLAAARRMLTAKDKVTREHRDKLVNRYISVSLFLMVFSALSAAGHIVYYFSALPTARDFISLGSAAAICALSAWMFAGRKQLRMQKA